MMKSRLRVVLVGTLCSALALPAAPQQRAVPSFGADVALVRISVVVRDKSGAPVRGLTRQDFVITEDGRPQTIEAFEFEEVTTRPSDEPASADLLKPGSVVIPPPAETPDATPPTPAPAAPPGPADLAGHRLIVLLFDANGMEPDQLERAARSATDYIDKRMSPADLVAVAAIGSGLEVAQDFTSDRALLRRALDRVMGTDAASGEAAVADDTSAAAATEDEQAAPDPFASDTSELDLFNIDRRLRAIEDLAKALAPITQKKSVIYFSGGMSGMGLDNQVELRAAVDRAVKANLSFYPVDTRGLTATVPGGEARQASSSGADVFSGRALRRQFDQQLGSQDTLASLANDTGGKAFFDTNDFGGVYERVSSDTSAYYVLGYASTNPAKDGQFRRVKVRLKRSDLRVEHRAGYYAERDFAHARHEDRERQLQDQLLSDLSSRDFPVWLQAVHFRTGDNRFYVPLSVTVPGSALPQEAGDPKKASLDLIGVVHDEARRAVARLRDTVQVQSPDVRGKSVQYHTGFTLPPGKYRLKVVVRENQGGSFGSFESDLVVPDLRQRGVKVSSVVLGTQLQPAPRGDAANPLVRDGSELLPSVTHVVSARQPLYFYYEVYDPARGEGGTPRLLTSISFFRGGARRYETPLLEVQRLAASDRGAALFQIAVPAASLKPGFYVCQVNVIDDVAGTFTFPRLALLVRP